MRVESGSTDFGQIVKIALYSQTRFLSIRICRQKPNNFDFRKLLKPVDFFVNTFFVNGDSVDKVQSDFDNLFKIGTTTFNYHFFLETVVLCLRPPQAVFVLQFSNIVSHVVIMVVLCVLRCCVEVVVAERVFARRVCTPCGFQRTQPIHFRFFVDI